MIDQIFCEDEEYLKSLPNRPKKKKTIEFPNPKQSIMDNEENNTSPQKEKESSNKEKGNENQIKKEEKEKQDNKDLLKTENIELIIENTLRLRTKTVYKDSPEVLPKSTQRITSLSVSQPNLKDKFSNTKENKKDYRQSIYRMNSNNDMLYLNGYGPQSLTGDVKKLIPPFYLFSLFFSMVHKHYKYI